MRIARPQGRPKGALPPGGEGREAPVGGEP